MQQQACAKGRLLDHLVGGDLQALSHLVYEIRDHKGKLKTLVQLYAVAAMHNCIVQIGDGTTVQLRGNPLNGR
jgi:hypothetical protein